MNENSEVQIIESDNDDRCMVVFGGVNGGVGIPPFEFLRTLQMYPCRKVFLRDLRQCWYLRGITGLGESPEAVATWLQGQCRPERTLLLGNSMGGYAALLFGALLPGCRVLAFSPQTFLGCLTRLRHGGFRWRQQLRAVWGHTDPGYWDLSRLFQKLQPGLKGSLVYPQHCRLDRVHALRLRNHASAHFNLSPENSSSHRLVKELRDEGRLPQLIEAMLPPR